MRNAKKLLLALLVLALLVGGIWYVRHSTAPAPAWTPGGPGAPTGRNAPTSVKAENVRTGDVPIYLSGLGTVTAANTAIVRARVSGQLMKLHFKEGQLVKAGQLLAELDPRTFNVELARAQADLATNRATLANARADLERYRALAKQESVAQQRVDTAASEVERLAATVKGSEAAVASARLQLEFSRVTAPIDGRVGLRKVDIGNQVATSDADGIVTITQIQPIHVLFSLPEARLGEVVTPYYAGQTLQVEAFNRESAKVLATGTLSSVDNQVDTTTGTFRLKAEFSNADNALFPNQFVNARIRTTILKNAVIAPSAAVQVGQQGSYVWVLDEQNKVKRVVVKVGQRDGEQIVITEGLSSGQRVVTDGVDRLNDGMTVTVVDAAQPASALPPSTSGGRRGRGPAQ